MAILRLFASVREAAGTGRTEVEGDTVQAVIDAAVDRFGAGFSDQVQLCRVWVDGEPAELSQPVTDRSEVALLPPVSGGS